MTSDEIHLEVSRVLANEHRTQAEIIRAMNLMLKEAEANLATLSRLTAKMK